jgi:5-formyltetrahydrofolate cyclo-ligase
MDESKAKQALRARMRATRAALSAEERDATGRLVSDAVLGLEPVRRARSVLTFASFGSEIPTTGLIDGLHSAAKRVLLPYLEDGAMEAAVVERGTAMVATPYGALEPAGRTAADPAWIDVVIAPGLAFDRRGYRLGYGGAYFDRYLVRLRPEAVRIGVGFAFQVVDEVPTAAHDERLDLLVTEAGLTVCHPPRVPAEG